MNSPLDLLRMALGPFSTGLRAPEALSDPSEMVRARQRVLREHSSAGIEAPSRSIMSALATFRGSGEVSSFQELKYVCLGMSAVDQHGWCALSDSKLRARVAELVELQHEMRRRIRCFQALLSSYWSFPKNGKQTSTESTAGWVELRAWLQAERERIVESKEPTPPWFAILSARAALLSDHPCDQFGEALLRGDLTELRETMEGLAIPSNSWVSEEAVIAHVRAGCALNDGSFKASLPNLVAIASDRGGVNLGDSLRMRSVALLVSRYARCGDRSENMMLRDAAVAIIGNPWLRRVNWDAWVVDANGKPDNQSREMVNSWLKRRLITDFFELLSVDGIGDSRRVNYWLRFEPVIEDMWFALGPDAQARRSEQFNDFKSRSKGRLLNLDRTSAENNAFVMRVGRYLLVEFGAKGNAMFVFKWDALGQHLLQTLTSGRVLASVSIHELKDRENVMRLIHQDSAAQSWEQKFDAALVPLIGSRPSDPLRRAAVVSRVERVGFTLLTWSAFVRRHSLVVEDNRAKRGSLWVLGEDQPSHVVAQLEAWGFKKRSPKGWWKE